MCVYITATYCSQSMQWADPGDPATIGHSPGTDVLFDDSSVADYWEGLKITTAQYPGESTDGTGKE